MILRLSELLDPALKGAGLEATSAIWRIAESWAEIVGPRIATRAAPVRIRGDELVLAAPDAVWRQELTMLGPEIADRVNRNLGKPLIRRIRLISGDTRDPESPRRRRRRLRVRRPESGASSPARPQPAAPGAPPPSDLATALEALTAARERRIEADRVPPRRGRGRRA